MKVTNMMTDECGGQELLVKELERVWKDDPKVLAAILAKSSYEDHAEFTSLSGYHSKGIYVTPFESGVSVQVHWGYIPSGSRNPYGGCDLDLVVA